MKNLLVKEEWGGDLYGRPSALDPLLLPINLLLII